MTRNINTHVDSDGYEITEAQYLDENSNVVRTEIISDGWDFDLEAEQELNFNE